MLADSAGIRMIRKGLICLYEFLIQGNARYLSRRDRSAQKGDSCDDRQYNCPAVKFYFPLVLNFDQRNGNLKGELWFVCQQSSAEPPRTGAGIEPRKPSMSKTIEKRPLWIEITVSSLVGAIGSAVSYDGSTTSNIGYWAAWHLSWSLIKSPERYGHAPCALTHYL